MIMKPRRRVVKSEDGYTVFVQPPDMFKLPEVSVFLTPDQFDRYVRWQAGGDVIQNLLPDLTISEREMLMSGLSDLDFDRMCGT
jgi:hypothetical protein